MVKMTDYSTRTPVATQERGESSTVLLSEPAQPSRAVAESLKRLSPAERRMLALIVAILRQNGDPAQGVTLLKHVSRAMIADAMNKPALVPYDVRKLRSLAENGLLVEIRLTNPRDLGGFEFVYNLPEPLRAELVEYFDPDAFTARRAAIADERARMEAEALAANPELQLARANKGRNFETDTHIYQWDSWKENHQKRRKTWLDKLASKLRRRSARTVNAAG